MSYIKLDDVTNADLVGLWKVKHRLTSNTNVGQLFARCNLLKFTARQTFTVITLDGKRKNGHWEMIREKDMIYNPQVRFKLPKKEQVNSIITNLMTIDHDQYKLILYFDSGIELVLRKVLATPLHSKTNR